MMSKNLQRDALASSGQPKPGGFKQRRILVVEDDVLVGQTLKNLLKKFGYGVSIASVGLAALDLASRERFDLIISDIRMPGMGGIDTLKAIRELRKEFGLPQLPEMIITAFPEEPVELEAQRMGITDFICKPFLVSAFLEAIERNLKKRKNELARRSGPLSEAADAHARQTSVASTEM